MTYTLGQIRKVCLALPEAVEKPFGDHREPCYRVREKIFVFVGEDPPSITLKVPPGVNSILIGDDANQFFMPHYVGSKGWVGVNLRHVSDRGEVDELIRESYRLIAPKKLGDLIENGLARSTDASARARSNFRMSRPK